MFQRPLTLILLQKYRNTNGSCIVIQFGGVYTTFCQEEGILSQKYRDRNGRYFSEVSGSGADLTLLNYTTKSLKLRSRQRADIQRMNSHEGHFFRMAQEPNQNRKANWNHCSRNRTGTGNRNWTSESLCHTVSSPGNVFLIGTVRIDETGTARTVQP